MKENNIQKKYACNNAFKLSTRLFITIGIQVNIDIISRSYINEILIDHTVE